jgi:hypothetical protein
MSGKRRAAAAEVAYSMASPVAARQRSTQRRQNPHSPS